VNRSAKASSLARCPACGTECVMGSEDVTDLEESAPPYAAGWPRPRAESVATAPSHRLPVGATIFAGLAVGTLITYLLVRRRR
jgi:hypothetical protein